MRFVPRAPHEGINVSKAHPLAEAGLLVIGLSAIFACILLALVFFVEIAIRYVTPETEARLFRNWLPDDLVTVSPFDERLEQTQQLTDSLLRHWPDVPYEIRVEIDDADVSNAMALPGGLILVTRGLLDQVESENELAFVIAHELGHFKNRDHLRALGRGVMFSVVMTVFRGKDVGGIGLTAADATLRGFSRRQESRADAFALSLVQSRYGHVAEAWRLFERWNENDGHAASALIAYLSTHPRTGDRIVELEALAGRNGWMPDGDVRALPWEKEKAPLP